MEAFETKTLGITDWILLVGILVVSSSIGVYSALRGRGNNSTDEFLLGNRKMSPIPVAISLLGGVVSAISIIGFSAEIYFFGTQVSLNLFGVAYGMLIVQELILPVLYPLEILSINEYIVLRFGSKGLKNLGSLILIAAALFYMGMCLYAPALSLTTMTGLSPQLSIVIMGLICTFYITVGGVKAVVYTDVVQMFIAFLGLLLTVVFCVLDLKSLSYIFQAADEGGRLEFFNMTPDPFIRHTFWSVHFIGGFNIIFLMGLNQPSYMRFASVSSLSMAKRLCVWFTVGQVVMWLLVYFSGIVAYATYSKCDPLTLGAIEKPDQILPYLVLDKLSHIPGLVGLFVAALYGGVLSSVSSYGNSAASLLWQDFFRELAVFRGISDANATRVVMLLSVVAGLAGTGFGIFVGQLGNVAQVAFTTATSSAGPIVGMFLSGICLPWVNHKGAYAGLVASLTFTVWLTTGQFVRGIGSPDKLPLSVEGCPESAFNIFNTSVEHVFNYTTTSSVSGTSLPGDREFYPVIGNQESKTEGPVYEQEQQPERDFYHLSYCYTGTLGMLISFVVSNIVSFLTGPLNPNDLDPRLVSPRCLRFSKWLWKSVKDSGIA